MGTATATSPEDTIAAISTPPGEGGIGIVRISGADSTAIAGRIFVSSTGRDVARERRRVFYGEIRDGATVVDEVLVHVMRAPHSYTCEDVVEINCHGGAGPLNAVLDLVLREGARLAGPGEFTKRAFLNGRIDLVQAEAVIDRIRAQTRASLQAASAAASGALSKALGELSETLREVKAYIEAAVDFPDQDVPELITPELRGKVEGAADRMRALLATADAGRLFREGASVAIVGRPNVGKSSLFNALLRDARAIVTRQPGTTRDLIEEVITIEGIPVRLSDMAGLRDTEDEVEKIGVEVARQALSQAAVVLFVLDAVEGITPDDRALADEVDAFDAPVLPVLNKTDIAEQDLPATAERFSDAVPVSALTGAGLEELEARLAALLKGDARVAPDQGMVTRLHQKDSLRRALDGLEQLLDHFDASPEFLSMDLDESLRALGEITGETTPDDLLEQIFSSFCIGK